MQKILFPCCLDSPLFSTKLVEIENMSHRDVPSSDLCTRKMPVLGRAMLGQELQTLSARDRKRTGRAALLYYLWSCPKIGLAVLRNCV